MGGIRQSYIRVWNQSEVFWNKMKKRHAALWTFLEAFVRMNNEGKMRILEVGGAYGYVSEWAKGRYVGIERSPSMIELGKQKYPDAKFINDDFVHMDTRQFQAQFFHLVFAAGVIEHCPEYQTFIRRALDVNAPTIVITFFRGLLRDEDHFQKVVSPEAIYYENYYSGKRLTEFLEREGIQHEFFLIRGNDGEPKLSDVVLVIDVRGTMDDGWREKVDSLGMTIRGYGKEFEESWQTTQALKQRQSDVRADRAMAAAKRIASSLKVEPETT
jgi:2-polyprenyl-3-methyl-5-hydroxy-6-metoxy-1,4-benzoquinol methylase